MKQTFKIILLSALGTAAIIKGMPALAEPTASPALMTVVTTADLDLGTAVGQRTLDLRLIRAAAEVCGDVSNANLRGANDARRCRSDVLAAARAQSGRIMASRGAGRSILVAAAR